MKPTFPMYILKMTCEHVMWIHILLVLRLPLCASSYKTLSVHSIPACADRGEPPFCYQTAAVEIPSVHFCTQTHRHIHALHPQCKHSTTQAELERGHKGYNPMWKEWAVRGDEFDLKHDVSSQRFSAINKTMKTFIGGQAHPRNESGFFRKTQPLPNMLTHWFR